MVVLRDEWLDRTAIAKDDAKWALEALLISEEELFAIEKNQEEDAMPSKNFEEKSKGNYFLERN